MKRLVTFIDLAAICITILFLFFVALMSIRSVAVSVWQLAREMYAARDWWDWRVDHLFTDLVCAQMEGGVQSTH